MNFSRIMLDSKTVTSRNSISCVAYRSNYEWHSANISGSKCAVATDALVDELYGDGQASAADTH